MKGDAMSERTGIFAGDNPFELARSWLSEAEALEPNDPNAVSLASVDESGMPNVRVVLLKSIEDDAFVIYTNYTSAKGREILGSGKAAFVMHWKSLRRQVRVRGLVKREDGEIADNYYKSRPLESRYGAWASRQSQPLGSRDELMAEHAKVQERLSNDPDRPPFWGGLRIIPVEMEFWADGEYRLHDRFKWERATLDTNWKISRLFP